MDIKDFFQMSAGKWFSHRTSHHLGLNQSESGKSDLQMELLEKTDPAVVQICQQHQVKPELAVCGLRVTWEGYMQRDPSQLKGSTVLVPIADLEQASAGQLLRNVKSGEKIPSVSRYQMGADAALTLTIEDQSLSSEERIWFASPNLRLRTNVVKQPDGFGLASFSSEIRMGVTQLPVNTDAQVSQASG
jgi:CpeS-like protein